MKKTLIWTLIIAGIVLIAVLIIVPIPTAASRKRIAKQLSRIMEKSIKVKEKAEDAEKKRLDNLSPSDSVDDLPNSDDVRGVIDRGRNRFADTIRDILASASG